MIALYGLERRMLLEERIKFLNHRTMTVYEPIDQEAYNEFLDALHEKEQGDGSSNVIPFSFELDIEEDDEEDIDSSFWFVYADPQDYLVANLETKVPRYFSSYLIPASDFHPLTFVREGTPSELVLATSLISSISNPQIYDAEKNVWMTVNEFLASVSENQLWMTFPNEERLRFLAPYRKLLKEGVRTT